MKNIEPNEKLEYLKTVILNELTNNASKIYPITSKRLCDKFNLSFRQLKVIITELRKDGNPIVAKETNGGGYWIAEDEVDILDFIKMITKRKNGYEETILAMQECLTGFNNIPLI